MLFLTYQLILVIEYFSSWDWWV